VTILAELYFSENKQARKRKLGLCLRIPSGIPSLDEHGV
jgi:hypothetical protein